MIRSMTAYANAEASGPAGTLACELRTVNHRYLDISPRLPDELRRFEPQLRERIAARLSRGNVDVTVRARADDGAGARLQVDGEVLAHLAEARAVTAVQFPDQRVEFTELLRFPGVLRQAEIDPQAQQQALLELLDQALDTLAATREREGAKLAAVLGEKLDGIVAVVAELRRCMPQIREGVRNRLQARLAELAQAAEPGRLEQELVLQLSRADVEEELDRLDAHISETRRVLGLREPVGRRLDFLMQEFNREANTLGSKSIDSRSSAAAVELKVLIEQMREQVQNIE
ncbi:MAG TPA: YicC/YloC family endoribonuclease [Rhodanobacteraceae bacterium]|nr:YicC/YloC family endoribonuclease [Rhodanobacteraceae bacterium]